MWTGFLPSMITERDGGGHAPVRGVRALVTEAAAGADAAAQPAEVRASTGYVPNTLSAIGNSPGLPALYLSIRAPDNVLSTHVSDPPTASTRVDTADGVRRRRTLGQVMPSILIVANQTLGGDALIARIADWLAAGPCDFCVVVPATPPKELWTWTEGQGEAIASRRLERCLDRLRSAGVGADGEVGDANPILAINDALRHRTFDAAIVATLPAGLSRWLKLSLPERVARRFNIPVDHVVVGQVMPSSSIPL